MRANTMANQQHSPDTNGQVKAGDSASKLPSDERPAAASQGVRDMVRRLIHDQTRVNAEADAAAKRRKTSTG